jgi:hypothetical protein
MTQAAKSGPNMAIGRADSGAKYYRIVASGGQNRAESASDSGFSVKSA